MTFDSMRAAFSKLGEPFPGEDEIRSKFGASEYGILKMLRPDKADEIFSAYLEEYKIRLPKSVPDLFGGMRAVLDKILSRGDAIAMVTGKHQATADFSIKFYRIEKYFKIVRYGAPKRSEKTERLRGLLEAELRDCDRENSYYIGDMPRDISESREAGFIPIAAAWSRLADISKLSEQNPYKIFKSVSEFSGFVDGL